MDSGPRNDRQWGSARETSPGSARAARPMPSARPARAVRRSARAARRFDQDVASLEWIDDATVAAGLADGRVVALAVK